MTDDESVESREQKFDRQTKESFEHLGRFVQGFEFMVSSIRNGILNLTSKGTHHQRLMLIILSHGSLTAGPLVDIYRSLLAEIVNDPQYKIDDETRLLTLDILSETDHEYRSLVTSRNDLLHGTWFIGWASGADNDFSGLSVSKFKASTKGFAVAPTPKNIGELNVLIKRCKQLRDNMISLDMCFTIPEHHSVKSVFAKVEKK